MAGWIRQRRLEHCGHDLRDPRWQAWPVAAVGARWGYPDPAHFSRLFKALRRARVRRGLPQPAVPA